MPSGKEMYLWWSGPAESMFVYYLTGALMISLIAVISSTRALRRVESIVTELIHQDNTRDVLVPYLLKIVTSLNSGCGCPRSAKVSIQLKGEHKMSQYFQLRSKTGGKAMLDRGLTDIFLFKVPDTLGEIISVKIFVSGLSRPLRWRLKEVQLYSPATGDIVDLPVTATLTEVLELDGPAPILTHESLSGWLKRSLLLYHQWFAMYGNTIRLGAFTEIIHVLSVFTALLSLLLLTQIAYISLPRGEGLITRPQLTTDDNEDDDSRPFNIKMSSFFLGTIPAAAGCSMLILGLEIVLRNVRSSQNNPGIAYYTLCDTRSTSGYTKERTAICNVEDIISVISPSFYLHSCDIEETITVKQGIGVARQMPYYLERLFSFLEIEHTRYIKKQEEMDLEASKKAQVPVSDDTEKHEENDDKLKHEIVMPTLSDLCLDPLLVSDSSLKQSTDGIYLDILKNTKAPSRFSDVHRDESNVKSENDDKLKHVIVMPTLSDLCLDPLLVSDSSLKQSTDGIYLDSLKNTKAPSRFSDVHRAESNVKSENDDKLKHVIVMPTLSDLCLDPLLVSDSSLKQSTDGIYLDSLKNTKAPSRFSDVHRAESNVKQLPISSETNQCGILSEQPDTSDTERIDGSDSLGNTAVSDLSMKSNRTADCFIDIDGMDCNVHHSGIEDVMGGNINNLHGLKEDGMFCTICTKHAKKDTKAYRQSGGAWVEKAVKNYKKAKEKMREHENGDNHSLSLERMALSKQVQDTGNVLDVAIKGHADNLRAQKEHNRTILKKFLRTIYYLCQNRRPVFGDAFMGILELQMENGLDDVRDFLANAPKNANYTSNQIIDEFIVAISTWIEEGILASLKASPVFSLLLDESQDISTVEELSVCARWISPQGQPEEHFLGVLNMKRTDAATITNRAIEFMDSKATLNSEEMVALISHLSVEIIVNTVYQIVRMLHLQDNIVLLDIVLQSHNIMLLVNHTITVLMYMIHYETDNIYLMRQISLVNDVHCMLAELLKGCFGLVVQFNLVPWKTLKNLVNRDLKMHLEIDCYEHLHAYVDGNICEYSTEETVKRLCVYVEDIAKTEAWDDIHNNDKFFTNILVKVQLLKTLKNQVRQLTKKKFRFDKANDLLPKEPKSRLHLLAEKRRTPAMFTISDVKVCKVLLERYSAELGQYLQNLTDIHERMKKVTERQGFAQSLNGSVLLAQAALHPHVITKPGAELTNRMFKFDNYVHLKRTENLLARSYEERAIDQVEFLLKSIETDYQLKCDQQRTFDMIINDIIVKVDTVTEVLSQDVEGLMHRSVKLGSHIGGTENSQEVQDMTKSEVSDLDMTVDEEDFLPDEMNSDLDENIINVRSVDDDLDENIINVRSVDDNLDENNSGFNDIIEGMNSVRRQVVQDLKDEETIKNMETHRYIERAKQKRNYLHRIQVNTIIDNYYMLDDDDESQTLTQAGLYQLEYDCLGEGRKCLPPWLKMLTVMLILMLQVLIIVYITVIGQQFTTTELQEWMCYFLMAVAMFGLVLEPLRAYFIAVLMRNLQQKLWPK